MVKYIQTTKNGWPDLGAKKKDMMEVYIECKQPCFKPSPLQLLRHKELRDLGHQVIVATSIEDVKHLL